MLVSKSAKIEAVCSKDETRQNLASPYLDLTVKDDPRLVATDGHMMVALKVQTDEHDETGFVSLDALKALRKAGPRAELACNGACVLPGGASFPRPDVGQFPDWRWVAPKEDREGEQAIAFDAKYLKAIVDACGGDGKVTIRFPAAMPDAPIRVEVWGAKEHMAVLMPCRI